MQHYDIAVIGGGINGAGIARDAAGRGLSVALVEQHDLASHTSSASTKLIHGGLRYLEHFEFGLVRKALQERELLLRAAPHLIRPLRFVMPVERQERPEWIIRAGLFLCDHLARRDLLPASETITLDGHPAGIPLRPGFRKGFEYSDAWVDDARLVVLNALDAAQYGAAVLTRTVCAAATRGDDKWLLELRCADGTRSVSATAVVNATGPWVARFVRDVLRVPTQFAVRLDKGSHIIVPRLFDHRYAYIFQNPDQRIVFAIPYEAEFTLIGTTDVEYHGDPASATIDASEIDYLCGVANRHFRSSIGAADVKWSYSGVRPLLNDEAADPSSVTRDYHLELDRDGAPSLSVFGGKITTYRALAEQTMDLLAPLLSPARGAWTSTATLPGGDIGDRFDAWLGDFRRQHTWLPAPLAQRYAHAYGTRAQIILDGAHDLASLGAEVLPGLYAAELAYLRRHEWARTADDILWRRSKLGLHLPRDAAAQLTAWLTQHP